MSGIEESTLESQGQTFVEIHTTKIIIPFHFHTVSNDFLIHSM